MRADDGGVGMGQDERDAVMRLREGDIGGLETLVQLYQLAAIRAAFAITGDRDAAEDAVADAFVIVYERIGQFDLRRAFRPWFYRIVVNNALKIVRRQRRVIPLPPDNEGHPGYALGPEADSLASEGRQHLHDAVALLPAPQRAALVLRYYVDMDEREIAHALGCPRGTVKWRLHAARRRLREHLSAYFVEEVLP